MKTAIDTSDTLPLLLPTEPQAVSAITPVPESQSKPSNPHVLTSESQLIVHTKTAALLLQSDWRIRYLGLPQFISLIKRLWHAFNADDPYAEWHFEKLCKEIEEAKCQLDNAEVTLNQQLAGLRGFKIELFKNLEPVLFPLPYLSPYISMTAILIEQVDYLSRQLFTLNRLSLTPFENLKHGYLINIVRKIFQLSAQWRYTGVTRPDILQNNQKAQKAEKLMGKIPDDILHQRIQIKFLPRRKKVVEEQREG